MDNKKTNNTGRCLCKNHSIYGNIYLNLSKNNKYYIRTKNDNNNVNTYSIPNDINNKDLKLFQAIKLIEDNIFKNNDHNIEFEQNIKEIRQNLTEIKPEINNVKSGVIIGKIGKDNVFLNKSQYNDKYYLRLSSSTENITIPIHYDIQKLTIEDAKDIIDFHKRYNNKIIGTREGKEIKIKNGKYSLYISYDDKIYSIPKYILDNLELLNIESCYNIIDYHINKASKIKEEIKPIQKKSFLDIVKNK